MPADWKRITTLAAFRVMKESIWVKFDDGRSHQVWVDEGSGSGELRLWAIAAPRQRFCPQRRPEGQGAARPGAPSAGLEPQPASDLVGFKIDGKGRLIGEAWVPTAGLGREEWETYVLAVARTCDRLEASMTGRDEL